jgi:Flp pilus assembly pilin Flp
MKVLAQLWRDDVGFVISSELILIATILVIGMIVGLATLRDQVVQELGDVGAAFSQLVQSYSFSGITGHTSVTAGSAFADFTDFCDDPAEEAGLPPLCISVTEPASVEAE